MVGPLLYQSCLVLLLTLMGEGQLLLFNAFSPGKRFSEVLVLLCFLDDEVGLVEEKLVWVVVLVVPTSFIAFLKWTPFLQGSSLETECG